MSAQKRRRPYLPSRGVAIAGGIAGMVFAAFCFRDAYERRGKQRPAAVSWLGI